MFPRWLSWAFVLMMGYVIYSASRGPVATPTATPVVPAITHEQYPALAEATDAEHWKRALNPGYAATMNCALDVPQGYKGLRASVMEETAGEGDAAACGQTITLQVTVWNAAGAKAFDGEFPLALGSRQVAAGLDHGLLGMKPHAVRQLILPPYALVHGNAGKDLAAVRRALAAETVAIITATRVK